MTTAFSVLYPSERSITGLIFRPLVDPRSYVRVFHLLLMFPLGLAYFVFFVTAFSVGGSLAWTFVGLGLLFLAMFISLRLADLEAFLVSEVSGVPVRRPPQQLEGVTSLREKVWARAIDPTTWTGLVYLIAQFPIGIGALVAVIAVFATGGALLVSPLIIWVTGGPVTLFGDESPALVLDSPLEALAFVPLGAIVLVAAVHIIGMLSALHSMWARFMLGSKARPRPSSLGPPAIHPETPLPPAPPPQTTLPPPVQPRRTGAMANIQPEITDTPPEMATLTQREREVMLLLARGLSNAEIAETCFISEGTVKTHVKRILSKLDLHDRTQVVVFAYEHGLVQPGTRSDETGKIIPFDRRLRQQS